MELLSPSSRQKKSTSNKILKFLAPKNLIKFPNTVSEATLGTLKTLTLKKDTFFKIISTKKLSSKMLSQNCFLWKY